MVHEYTVVTSKKITPTIQLLTLELAEGSEPLLYQPGQYAAIGVRDRIRPTVMRCFSITTSPTNQRYLQFSMRVQGRFTSATGRLKPGDTVGVRGPFGGFVFDQHNHKDIVLFAGGIGIAPFISMIRYATECGLNNKIHLIYSIRNQSDVAFWQELEELKQKNPNLSVTYVVAEGSIEKMKNAPIIIGRVDASNVGQLNLKYQSQTFFICGPPAYMKAMNNLLSQHGVPSQRILTEAFSQGSHKQTGKLRSWPFNMYALTGLALVVGGFYVVASDLFQTLPKLQKQAASNTASSNTDATSENVTTLEPQVDTNLTQEPIVNNQSSSTSSSDTSSSSQGTTSTTPSVTSTPTTTQPTTSPQTTVS